MRTFKTKAFTRFARKERISDTALCEAVARAERGAIDADLGGGIVERRVARPGQGRSGGFRTLTAYRSSTRAVFIHGFAKSDLDNIDDAEAADLRKAARTYMALTDQDLDRAVAEKRLLEIECDDEALQE